jgi:hypothetical protein
MKRKKETILISIIIWSIIAGFFYAAIWTDDSYSLSECLFQTGCAAALQVFFTVMFCLFLENK